MRDLNLAQLAAIADNTAVKPITIIEVAWNGVYKYAYADYDLSNPDGTPYTNGVLLEVTGLDNVINVSNNATSQQLSVTIDDTSGQIFELMQKMDVHLKPVWVYQYFEELALTDKFLLFKGYINSPLEWSESDRTVSFTVLSQLDGLEVGFSPEDSMLRNLSPEMVGVAWPMTFGTVHGVRALRLTSLMRGTLADGFGIADFTLLDKIKAELTILNYKHGGCVVDYLTGQMGLAPGAPIGSVCEADPSGYLEYSETVCTYGCQATTQLDQFRIIDGELFPRGTITIRIDEAVLEGHFIDNSNIFQLHNVGSNYKKNHPLYSKFVQYNQTQTSTTYLPAPSECVCQTRVDDSKIKVYPYPIYRSKVNEKEQTTIQPTIQTYNYTGEIGGDTAGYVYLSPGSNVDLVTGQAQKYIVNIMPGTVFEMYTQSIQNGTGFLVKVPTNLYTVGTMTYGPLTVITIDIPIALSQINDTWQDDIYVKFKSDVGPNTVDIIEWLIDTYTDYLVDPVSFGLVRTKLQNLPSSFTLYERREVFQLLQEIAWQAACALYVIDDTFYIKYLPDRPGPVDTILKTDISVESLRIGHTVTEDIITKMILEFKLTDSQENPSKIVLRHNVKKYGTKEETYPFYIYNWDYPIIKHGTFWLIRKANTWKKCLFKTPLTKLNLETFDYIDINLPGVLANTAVRSVIETASYDSENHSIDFECWTPVKSGEMTEYIFAYPNSAIETEIFPTASERAAGMLGSGNEFNQAVVGELPSRSTSSDPETPPSGLKVSGVKWPEKCPPGTHGIGYGRGSPPCYKDTEYPDSCEVDPTIPGCSPNDGGDSNPGADAGSAEGGGGMSETRPSEETGGKEPGPQTVDKDGVDRLDKNDDLTAEELLGDLYQQHPLELPTSPDETETCWFTVFVRWVNPVGLVHSGGLGCDTCPDNVGPGTICTGPLEKAAEKYYFGSCYSAQSFADAMRAYAATPTCTGSRHPYAATISGPLNKYDLPIAGGCAGLEEREEMCEGSHPGMIAFQPSEGSEQVDDDGNDGWTNFSNWAGANGYPSFL